VGTVRSPEFHSPEKLLLNSKNKTVTTINIAGKDTQVCLPTLKPLEEVWYIF
jgi:hypothetical protein